MTDAEIISRAAGGDRRAFALLYDRHWKAVYRYAWLLAKSVPDAEDVTQECFLALMRRPASFDPARSQLRTWLLAVARNQVLQRRRSETGRTAEVDDETPEITSGVEEMLIQRERAEALRRAFELLPTLQKETLFLVEFEGLSLAGTAAVLQIEPNAVKARLFRARERLKRLLDPQRAALKLEK